MAFQGRSWESNVRLTAPGGAPVTGVLHSQITVQVKKAGTVAFVTRTLTSAEWAETGDGYYTLKWADTDMSAVGPFLVRIAGSGLETRFFEFDVLPAPIASLASPQVCIVTGNITELGGEPGVGTPITFRLAKAPAASGDSLVRGAPIRTVPDLFGNFSVALLRGVKLIVEIEQVGLRHVITVPDESTKSLVDLLPPINNIL